MIRGRVLGEVWATRKSGGLEGRRLVLVGLPQQDQVLVAIDTLDVRRGQEVLVSVGSGARNVLSPGPDNRDLLCDAAISLLVDGEG
jgi:microcompartment protein CcmK/EutM